MLIARLQRRDLSKRWNGKISNLYWILLFKVYWLGIVIYHCSSSSQKWTPRIWASILLLSRNAKIFLGQLKGILKAGIVSVAPCSSFIQRKTHSIKLLLNSVHEIRIWSLPIRTKKWKTKIYAKWFSLTKDKREWLILIIKTNKKLSMELKRKKNDQKNISL